MFIKGTFYDVDNNKIDLEINSVQSEKGTLIIGEDGLWFDGESPIVIEQDSDSTFDHIIKTSCEINLHITKPLDLSLYAYGKRSVTVTVRKNDSIIFFGYVEPNTYQQGFAYPIEELTINAIDALSTLQYDNFMNITVKNYETQKYAADSKSFKQIIVELFNGVRNDMSGFKILYTPKWDVNPSSALTSNQFLDNLYLSELSFIGDDFDDVETNEDVLEKILQYLNYHIVQIGTTFYIFHWDKIKSLNTKWVNLENGTGYFQAVEKVTLNSNMHADADTNFTIGEVYNQLELTCSIQSQDTVISSPLDSDTYEDGTFRKKDLFCREYISEGEGKTAFNAMKAMINGKSTTYDQAKTVDWFIRVVDNRYWRLHVNPSGDLIQSIYETDGNGNYINQWKVPYYIYNNRLTPMLCQMGNVEKVKGSTGDDEPKSKVSMTDYMYISINGNNNDTNPQPTDSELELNQGFCEYIGNATGGMLSPADAESTNYLVFSGTLLLQPLIRETGNGYASEYFQYLWENGFPMNVWHKTVPSSNNEYGRYYSRQFFKEDEKKWLSYEYSLNPYTDDKSPKSMQYNYNPEGSSTDEVSRIDVLECELIVGDKRCTGNSTDGFKWIPNTKENSGKTFSLSFNPKIGDYLIGQEHHIANTLTYKDNINEEGTAIPIKKDDGLNGQIRFKILGPVNNYWDNVVRRHPTWFRHTKFTTTAQSILAHVQNIVIKDFKCQVFSDGGGLETLSDKDLLYVSDENHKYVERKDDLEFNIVTQLTAEEAYKLGVKPTVNLNSPSFKKDGVTVPFVGCYDLDSGEFEKLEKHYINSYYIEYSEPKYILETTLHDKNIKPFNTYYCTPLKADMYLTKWSIDVKKNEKKLTLKQV